MRMPAPAITIVVVVMRMFVSMPASAAAFVVVVMHMRVCLLVNAVYFYGRIIVHMQTLAAVIADFKRIKIAEFAFAAAYAIAVVQNALPVFGFYIFHNITLYNIAPVTQSVLKGLSFTKNFTQNKNKRLLFAYAYVIL